MKPKDKIIEKKTAEKVRPFVHLIFFLIMMYLRIRHRAVHWFIIAVIFPSIQDRAKLSLTANVQNLDPIYLSDFTVHVWSFMKTENILQIQNLP